MNTMLPAVPKTFGILKDVFISALGSITGVDNRLRFSKSKHACVVLVDGLGTENLRFAAGHARFLNAALATSKPISCAFPSTTVCSITSFGTGLRLESHGLVGYQVLNPATGLGQNLLTGWQDPKDALQWQPNPTVAELALDQGVVTYFIGPKDYQGSGFTQATMRGSSYVAAATIEDRVTAALKIMRDQPKSLIYLYVPELDQLAHQYGSQSERWLAQIEVLDSQLSRLTASAPAAAGIALTADHGIVDVSEENHIYLDEFDDLLPGLKLAAGDPRVAYLYFEKGAPEDLTPTKVALREALAGKALVCDFEELVAAGWMSAEMSPATRATVADLFVLPNQHSAVYHRKWAKAKSLKMIGQHGGMTPREMTVPLVLFGAWSKHQ